MIERIDRLLLHNINFTTFVTLFLGSYDPRTHELTYANAGHNPPLLYQAQSGAVVHLEPTGAAAGLIAGLALDAKTIRIYPGDVLFLYTDGLTEARNGLEEVFGLERRSELVRAGAAVFAAKLVQTVRAVIASFTQLTIIS